jgi:hypothetical protein
MDQDKRHQLREVQLREEILANNEFDFPFLRFDTLPRERIVIFWVVNIIGFRV